MMNRIPITLVVMMIAVSKKLAMKIKPSTRHSSQVTAKAHQYVLKYMAQQLLLVDQRARGTDMTLAAVANAASSSSHSHVTAAMRRARGITRPLFAETRRCGD
jgi:hypothetical protein